jgi:Activator of Hsp90 ATPase homolog 1-like protein
MSAARTVVQPGAEEAVRTFSIKREERIEASIDIVFETVLEQMGSLNVKPDGVPMPMKLEAWPGGRWFRDLGNNDGHMWGHVQAIKVPELLEIYGPLFMSFPATSNLQFRLKAEGNVTNLRFVHTAMGVIPEDVSANVGTGWNNMLEHIRAAAEGRKAGQR